MNPQKQATTDERSPIGPAPLSVIPGGKSGGMVSTDDYKRMNDEQAALVMRTYFPDLNKDEVSMFLDYSDIYKADPRKKESWATIRWSKKKGNDGRDKLDAQGNPIFERRVVMGLSKHKVQQRLEERPDFAGIESAVVYQKDVFEADLGVGQISHKVKSINLVERGMMVAAWCRISRKGKTPYIRILYASERQDERNFNWSKMGPTMLLKCVEMDGVRSCYPKEFAGVYDEAEADGFGEEMPAERMTEAITKVIDQPPPADPVMEAPAPPVPAGVDMTLKSRGGAFASIEQLTAIVAAAQEFHLDPGQIGDAIEKALKRRPKAIADITKPEFQKVAKLFECIRDGSYQLSGGKVLTPDDVADLNKKAEEERLPF